MSNFPKLIEAYIRQKQESKKREFCVQSWLDNAAKKASQISLATHVVKYLHSDAQGTNIYAKMDFSSQDKFSWYLSTSSLNKVQNDFVADAKAMDVPGLLEIEVNGVSLLQLIIQDDSSPFAPFAKDEAQLVSWMNGFKAVLNNTGLSSHTLAKQVYFPVEDGKYHLIAPLFASSLSQVLYDRIREDRFSEKAKEVRECKKKSLFSDAMIFDYLNLAIQTFGGTQPQNISRLNSNRNGRVFLLRSVPPVWKAIEKPPMRTDDFWKIYERKAYSVLKEFKQYLLKVNKLSSNKMIRDSRKEYINQMLDLLVQTVLEIQALQPGWSQSSNLTLYERLWLDPFFVNVDQNYMEMRSHEPWIEAVSRDFATWLINKLKHKNFEFGNVEYIELTSKCREILKAVEV